MDSIRSSSWSIVLALAAGQALGPATGFVSSADQVPLGARALAMGGAFSAYIRQIQLNQIRDQARRRRRRPEHVELTGDVAAQDRSLLDEVIGKQNMDRYERALAQLSDSHREAVILRVEMGYRYREIAEGMERATADAARKLVARALVQLAEIIRGHDGT